MPSAGRRTRRHWRRSSGRSPSPSAPNGRTFRVRGKGVRRPDGTTGDLLVTVNVQVPKNVNGEAREALETFRKVTAGDDPRDELLRQAKAG